MQKIITSSTYSLGSDTPAVIFGPPPWSFKALIVATITAAFGVKPEYLHLISQNFSKPISAPKPASVTKNKQKKSLLKSFISYFII